MTYFTLTQIYSDLNCPVSLNLWNYHNLYFGVCSEFGILLVKKAWKIAQRLPPWFDHMFLYEIFPELIKSVFKVFSFSS